jgi:serine/threonine-protein kinase SRPK3
MGIDDESVFSEYEKDELEHPVPRKVTEYRTIYLSRPPPLTFGPPILCDLGDARLGDEENRGDIMPDTYRAPEVILGMKWSYSVDIWNVGMVVCFQLSTKGKPSFRLISTIAIKKLIGLCQAWDLFEHNHIFQGRNSENEYDEIYHLAEVIAVLGPPPLNFLKQSDRSLQFWHENGQ